MRKILSVLLVAIIVSSLSLVAFASLPSENPVSGSSTEATRTIEGVRVEAYNCTSVAREVYNIVNRERAAAGVPAIQWNSDLTSAALTRALEQYVSPSHTRPDGSHLTTVHNLVNNENLAGGTDPSIFTASGVMEGWMDSQGHRETILEPAYVSMSVACVYTDQGIYWAQVFSRTHVDGVAPTTTTATTKTTAETTTKATTKVAAPATTTQSSTSSVRVKISDGSAKSANVLSVEEIKNYASKSLTLTADTLTNGSTSVRLYVNPSNLTQRTTEYKLSANTNSTNTNSVKTYFNKYFTNKVAVVEIEESNLMASTHVAAKIDLTGFNTSDLSFYTFSAKDNKYYPITDPQYKIDNNGFLHFYTATGGYIIVSSGKLSK